MANENGVWQSESHLKELRDVELSTLGPTIIKFKILERIAKEGDSPVQQR